MSKVRRDRPGSTSRPAPVRGFDCRPDQGGRLHQGWRKLGYL